MRQQKSGTILNVSSILGVVAIPYKGAYVASKYALDGITDSLRLELRDTPIKVILLNPGPVESAFRKNAKKHFDDVASIFKSSAHKANYDKAMQGDRHEKVSFSISSEAAAKTIFKIIRKSSPRARYFLTIPAHIFAWARRILPTSLLDTILARVV